MIFINFKTYEQGTGGDALALVKTLEKTANEEDIKIVLALQAADIKEAAENSKVEIWAQHIDPVNFGAHTGAVLPEAVAEDGAVGTFLNHSEKKFDDFGLLSKAVERAREAGLKTLVFAGDIEEMKRAISLNPTYLSYEPAELVGSKTTSVAKARPEVISEAVVITRDNGIPLIVGAGIKSHEDYKKSLELGAAGVAVASDIVLSDDPERELKELIGSRK
jgi:triosephosphate isomerase (TIM)